MIRRLLLVVPLLASASAASALPPDMMKQALDLEVAQLRPELKTMYAAMMHLISVDPTLDLPFAVDESFAKGWTRTDCDLQYARNYASWHDHNELAAYAAATVPQLRSIWLCDQKEKARQLDALQGRLNGSGGIGGGIAGGNPGPIDTSGLPNAPKGPAAVPPDPGCEFTKGVLAASAGLLTTEPRGGLVFPIIMPRPEIGRRRDACYAQVANAAAPAGGGSSLAQNCAEVAKEIKIFAGLSASCVLNPTLCLADATELTAMKALAVKLGCK